MVFAEARAAKDRASLEPTVAQGHVVRHSGLCIQRGSGWLSHVVGLSSLLRCTQMVGSDPVKVGVEIRAPGT